MIVKAIFVLAVFAHTVHGTMHEERMPDGTTKMSFESPDLSEEEQHSQFIPEVLKCDACTVVAYQLHKSFEEFNRLHKYLKYDVPESEVLDMFETTCSLDTFKDSYGVKTINGQNRLSGPGLDAKDLPGVLQGGGKWPGRIIDMCETYSGEVGEMAIYNGYKQKPKSVKHFKKFLCNGEGILGDCNKSDQRKDEL